MKIYTIGHQIQNNERTRYAIIKMVLNSDGTSYDNSMTFIYSNDIKKLIRLAYEQKREYAERNLNNNDYSTHLDINIFDYKEMHYVRF